ncbi:MAG TPA: hypothetical protein VNF68_12985 [Candidatus Baltobacteraceae bacterium]|nr:hypothetical protein [Candidatus Baltobacteraceae bacterium]
MYATPIAAARIARAPQPASDADAATGAAGGADPSVAVTAAQQQALATQRATFNYEAAEQAELEREREVLEEMVQAQLKFEDEVVKKWIAMI